MKNYLGLIFLLFAFTATAQKQSFSPVAYAQSHRASAR